MLLLPLVLLPLMALFVSAPLLVPLLFRALDFSSRPLLSSNFPFNLYTSPHQSKPSVQPAVYLLNTTFSSNVTTSRNASLSHGLFPVLDPVMFSSTKATIVYDVLRWNKRAIICGFIAGILVGVASSVILSVQRRETIAPPRVVEIEKIAVVEKEGTENVIDVASPANDSILKDIEIHLDADIPSPAPYRVSLTADAHQLPEKTRLLIVTYKDKRLYADITDYDCWKQWQNHLTQGFARWSHLRHNGKASCLSPKAIDLYCETWGNQFMCTPPAVHALQKLRTSNHIRTHFIQDGVSWIRIGAFREYLRKFQPHIRFSSAYAKQAMAQLADVDIFADIPSNAQPEPTKSTAPTTNPSTSTAPFQAGTPQGSHPSQIPVVPKPTPAPTRSSNASFAPSPPSTSASMSGVTEARRSGPSSTSPPSSNHATFPAQPGATATSATSSSAHAAPTRTPATSAGPSAPPPENSPGDFKRKMEACFAQNVRDEHGALLYVMWPGVYNFLRLMEGDIIYNYNALLTLVVTVTTSVSDKRDLVPVNALKDFFLRADPELRRFRTKNAYDAFCSMLEIPAGERATLPLSEDIYPEGFLGWKEFITNNPASVMLQTETGVIQYIRLPLLGQFGKHWLKEFQISVSTQHSLTSLCAQHRIAHDQGPLIARSQILPFFLQGYQEEQVFFQNPTVFHVFWNLLCVPLTQRPPFRRHTPQPPTVVPNPSDPRRPSNHVPQPGGTTAPGLSNQVKPVPRPSTPAPGAPPHRHTSSSSPQPASDASGSAPFRLIKEETDAASLPSVTDTTTSSKNRMPKVEKNRNGNAQEQVDIHKRVPESDGGAHRRAEGYE